MTPEVRRELEGLVGELRALVPRLRRHGQPLATQLIEMAVLEIRSRVYDINDEEFQALVDTLSGQDPSDETESAEISESPEGPGRTVPSARIVVELGQSNSSKRKRQN